MIIAFLHSRIITASIGCLKLDEGTITKMMKKLGYDKVTQITTKKKEEHKIEHIHSYYDNNKCPFRSTITLNALNKLINEIQNNVRNRTNKFKTGQENVPCHTRMSQIGQIV